jgi:hypothetical protein
MTDDVCKLCGAPLRPQRVGVAMTPLKARIFDVVKRAGECGISTADLRMVLGHRVSNITLRAHIWQINEILADTDYRIRSHYRMYRLVHERCHVERRRA